MGAVRIGQQSSSIRAYDALGQDSDTVTEFICHIGMASAAAVEPVASQGVAVNWVEMGPPLLVPQGNKPVGSTAKPVDVVGTLELTASEHKQIEAFIDEVDAELQSIEKLRQYTVHPHFRDRDASNSARRFSCAGLVQKAYEYANIDLVDTAALPGVGLDTVLAAYPDMQSGLTNPRMRQRVGLDGDGPWPILLPGYLFHAMNRDPQVCRSTPHKPSSGEGFFPSHAATVSVE